MLGKRTCVVLVLFDFFLVASLRAEAPHGGTNPPALGRVLPACILVDNTIPTHGTVKQGYPFFWATQMTGLDLARVFTESQKGPAEVRVAFEGLETSLFGLPSKRLGTAVQPSGAPPSNPSSNQKKAGLVVAPLPYGTSATAKLDFFLSHAGASRKDKHDRPAIFGADFLHDVSVDYLKTFSPPPMLVVRAGGHSSVKAPWMDELLSVHGISDSGFPSGRLPLRPMGFDVLSPQNVGQIFFDANGKILEAENGGTWNREYLPVSALSNALAIVPEIENKAVKEWTMLTASRDSLASAVTGLGLLNGYKLVRVMVRLKEKCKAEAFDACEKKWRTDEKRRAEILDFETEALESYNDAEVVLRNSAASCDDQKKAFAKLRAAVFLSPNNAKYRLALARVYEAEFYDKAGEFYRRGREIAPYDTDLLEWAKLSSEDLAVLRAFVSNSKVDLREPIKKALESKYWVEREGLVLATMAISDRDALDVLKGLVKKGDWEALRALERTVYSEILQVPPPKNKFLHYVPLLKSAIETMRADKTAKDSTAPMYATLRILMPYFSDEQRRHLVDYVAEQAMKGGELPHRLQATQALVDFSMYSAGGAFHNKYVDRALTQVLRGSEEADVVKRAADRLGYSEGERPWVMAILNERRAKTPALEPVYQYFQQLKWAK